MASRRFDFKKRWRSVCRIVFNNSCRSSELNAVSDAGDRANYAFADGHVQLLNANDIRCDTGECWWSVNPALVLEEEHGPFALRGGSVAAFCRPR